MLRGFTINILTLLGIVLATGLVVDDGIVVTENIFRKLEQGLPIRKAALEGSKEIFFCSCFNFSDAGGSIMRRSLPAGLCWPAVRGIRGACWQPPC